MKNINDQILTKLANIVKEVETEECAREGAK